MQAQTLTWTNYKWSVVERDVVFRNVPGKLRVCFDNLTGNWFWSVGVPGAIPDEGIIEGRCGVFAAETEDEAVAKAMRLAKKWGATW